MHIDRRSLAPGPAMSTYASPVGRRSMPRTKLHLVLRAAALLSRATTSGHAPLHNEAKGYGEKQSRCCKGNAASYNFAWQHLPSKALRPGVCSSHAAKQMRCR